jgi:UDP:flavonoid glycosyltransferase YjiC (YdhE family)
LPDTTKFNAITQKPLVIIGALDWGLGHTTRCIPLIRALLYNQCRVIVAGNDTQKALLALEFNEIAFVHLDGYNFAYGANARATFYKVILQIPKILTRIKQENAWLKQFLKENKADLIISDNRYGFYSTETPSIFITHQLAIKTGRGRLIDGIIRRLNYNYIKRFRCCWVPDSEARGLAGELSHPLKKPATPIRYIGPISRLYPCNPDMISGPAPYLLVMISGPEPQRTIFERIMLDELKDYNGTAVLLRGLPDTASTIPSSPKLIIHNHLPAQQLNELLCKVKVVISRSGYSSIMDLLKLKKKCIFIPTPGQPEQEYLAGYLYNKKIAMAYRQNSFSLKRALQRFNEFEFKEGEFGEENYKNIVVDTLREYC